MNFLPVSTGGGSQNAANLWRAVASRGSGDQWICVCRPGRGFEELTTEPWQQLAPVDPGGFAERLRAENQFIPRLARRWGADVVFTPMGAGPLSAGVPTVVGWHDPTVAYPESVLWRRVTASQRLWLKAREVYARKAVRKAARVCVQTDVMRSRLGARWGIAPKRFVIVPNGPSAFLSGEAPAAATREARRPWTVLVIGDPKPTKNLAVVPEVGAKLREMGMGDGRFVMTITSDRERHLHLFRDSLIRWGESVPIRRVGRVPHGELGALYRDADAVFLPSLLESFSASYLEAMHFGVPLVTSGYDFAKEICGPAAEYVDPLDAGDCARGLVRVLTDPHRRRTLRDAGFDRLPRFPDWGERFRRYRSACAAAAGVPEPSKVPA